MSAPRDLDRQIQAFLKEGPTELPDPSYDQVRDRIEQTRQRVVIGSWATPEISRMVGFGLAAAAVVLMAVIGLGLLGGLNVGEGGPSETPKATPSAAQPLGLPAGPFALTYADAFGVGMTVTIPADRWYGDVGEGILLKDNAVFPPDGAGLIVFTGSIEVYGDPCDWESTRPDPITGPTVEDVISALAVQAGRDASLPTDVTVEGYSGRAIQLRVPTDVDIAGCDGGQYRSWGPAPMNRYHQGPGQIDQVWVVDVDGERVVIDYSWYAGTPDEVRAELQAIVESIQFD